MIENDSIRSATEISLLEQESKQVRQEAVRGELFDSLPSIQRWPLLQWQQLRWRCCRFPSRPPAEIVPTAENQSHGAGRPPVG